MAKAVFDELRKPRPRNGFTVGIVDDVSHTSLTPDSGIPARPGRRGAGGVLWARRRRHGGRQQEQREDHRGGCRAVRPGLLRLRLAQVRRTDDIASAFRTAPDPGAVSDPAGRFHRLPPVPVRRAPRRAAARRARRHVAAQRPVRSGRSVGPSAAGHAARIIELGLRLFVIDASRVAQEVGLRGRTNTVLQTCFFAISGVLPRDKAIEHIKHAIRKTYGGKGDAVVEPTSARSTKRWPDCSRCGCPPRRAAYGSARPWWRTTRPRSCAR